MYPKDIHGDDMYDSNEYKKDSFGNEIYAKSENGTEIYLKINGTEIVAKKRNSNGNLVPYFAKDTEGHPICPFSPDMTHIEMDIPYPKNAENKELYPRRIGHEYYIGIHGNCKYARDENNEPYYAKQTGLEPYYAFKLNEKKDTVQYPIENNEGEIIYITRDDKIIYPENLTKRQIIFPLDSEGNPRYLEMNGKQFYAFSYGDGVIYAKNKEGDDILAADQGIPYYGFKMRKIGKQEIYPKLKNKNEYYLSHNNLKVYAKTPEKNEYYAQIVHSGEYCADNNGNEYYATNIDNVEIYPRNKKGFQFYKNINNCELIAINKKTNEGFYAKDKKLNEFYPKNFILEEEINIEEKHNLSTLTLKNIISHNATSAA